MALSMGHWTESGVCEEVQRPVSQCGDLLEVRSLITAGDAHCEKGLELRLRNWTE